MLKKEIAQVEQWFHTEAERFMLRHQGLGILLIFMGVPLAAAGCILSQSGYNSG